MKLNEIYSTISLILLSNFYYPIKKEDYEKLHKNWIITNESTYNQEGNKLLKNLGDYEGVIDDFNSLKDSFELDYFKIIDPINVDKFFNEARFMKPFEDKSNTNASNILGFIAMNLKLNPNSQILKNFLNDIAMSNLNALGGFITTNAKSNYYKAMGYFLLDFLNMLKISYKLKD